MLDAQQLAAYIDEHYREPGDQLYRLELLPFYADNAAMLARWRAGETEPDWDSAWSQHLADEKARGLISQRVRVLSKQLTDDERAACVLGYPANSRYEDIRVLHVGEHNIPRGLPQDYWLIEQANGRAHVLAMAYDPAPGVFLGANVIESVGAWLAARDQSLAAAEPWASWWPRHRDLGQRAA